MKIKMPKLAWIEILIDENSCHKHRVVRHRFGKKIEREFNVLAEDVDACIKVYSDTMKSAEEEFEVIRRDVS
jgi:hypothetical protein